MFGTSEQNRQTGSLKTDEVFFLPVWRWGLCGRVRGHQGAGTVGSGASMAESQQGSPPSWQTAVFGCSLTWQRAEEGGQLSWGCCKGTDPIQQGPSLMVSSRPKLPLQDPRLRVPSHRVTASQHGGAWCAPKHPGQVVTHTGFSCGCGKSEVAGRRYQRREGTSRSCVVTSRRQSPGRARAQGQALGWGGLSQGGGGLRS